MARCPDCRRQFWHPSEPLCSRCRLASKAHRALADVAWFERTGHCGSCGQPGTFCQCTSQEPCGCRDLHVMGSGINVDPVAAFGVADDGQGALFG